MPTYEMSILYRVLPKEKLKEAMKTTANLIFQEGGIIRKMSNLGQQATPYRMFVHGQPVKQAHYFVFEFDCPVSSVQKLSLEFKKYEEITRANIFSPVIPLDFSACKIEEETQIAPFRKDVIRMLSLAKKAQEERDEGKTKPNHGLDFDPFPL
ncbi:putative 28S ribosomal protein S6, mitochondrial [Frankliniella fusca]|uniref:Small ribosomal subunit protein bS6m n=1 Tax=Frankliniella fusca TaxID=407009 RepID=A0AAE1I3R8_9NEOP|nr:putative 28S ribosomal protein S6, mitochondrial [Frankliniella fusca]